jgi:hypothetical protein
VRSFGREVLLPDRLEIGQKSGVYFVQGGQENAVLVPASLDSFSMLRTWRRVTTTATRPEMAEPMPAASVVQKSAIGGVGHGPNPRGSHPTCRASPEAAAQGCSESELLDPSGRLDAQGAGRRAQGTADVATLGFLCPTQTG